MSKQPDQVLKQFEQDIARHEMTVARDEGNSRYLRFRRPATNNYWFDIVTSDGWLMITGDMGTFVFRRLPDMFEFFRTDPGGELRINRGYWSEKLVGIDRSGYRQYEAELFRAAINDWLNDAEDITDEVREEVEEQVLCYADDGQHAAVAAALDYRFEGRQIFRDFYEVTVTDYTFGFTWCCYAVAWAVKQYDHLKAGGTDDAGIS